MWFVLAIHMCAFPPVSNINSPYSHRHLLARSLCWLSFWWYGLRLVWMSPLRTSAHTCNGVECMGKESKTLSREMFAIYIHRRLKEYMQNSWHIYFEFFPPPHQPLAFASRIKPIYPGWSSLQAKPRQRGCSDMVAIMRQSWTFFICLLNQSVKIPWICVVMQEWGFLANGPNI